MHVVVCVLSKLPCLIEANADYKDHHSNDDSDHEYDSHMQYDTHEGSDSTSRLNFTWGHKSRPSQEITA